MSFNDSLMSVGYYSVAGSSVAQHTYAFIERQGVAWAFPCYGFVADRPGYRGTSGMVYAADTWTPYIWGSSRAGTHRPANLHVALGIAQFTRNPKANFRYADWDAYWEAGAIEGAACWSGIPYALGGVCHQVCNRVLFATHEHSFDYTPINWPPSFTATYWVYGFWGKHADKAFALAAQLVDDVKQGRAPAVGLGAAPAGEEPPPPPRGIPDDRLRAEAETIGSDLRGPAQSDQRTAFINGLLEREGTPLTAVHHTGIVDVDARFQVLKRELDIQLIREEISSAAYAAAVNAGFQALTTELHDIMPAEQFEHLFPDLSADEGYQIINPGLMLPNYGELRPYARL